MINTSTNSSFPSQVVPVAEKLSLEYGLQVGQAIEYEWFRGGRVNGTRWQKGFQNFNRLRLYARGEQPVQKYKDELSINGDLSYLNLDWKPVPIIPKFVDIVVNGISSKKYDIKAYAQDPFSLKQRTNYASSILRDMLSKPLLNSIQENLGVDVYNVVDPANLPQSKEELEVHMQLNYKQSIEIAEEEVINNVLDFNKYELINKRVIEDIVTVGIGAVKTSFNKAEGVKIDYVNPSNLVYSYTNDPNFQDLYYVGEIKSITLPELKKEFPNLTNEELKTIQKYPGREGYMRNRNNDDDLVQVIYFEYKSYIDQVFKVKNTDNGLEKVLEKPDTFNPPESDNFERVSRTIEVLFTGAKVMGVEQMLKWEMSENMTRPKSDLTKVNMNYNIVAPHMYQGRIDSLVGRITGFADMIQLTSLKLQQVIARMVPDGVFVDVDGLSEVDLGNGTNYNPQEALNMYFQTGSVIGRSMTQDGDMNRGRLPITELNSNGGNNKINALISTYNYYLQMMRDVTGLNEARDGGIPDKNALVGLQKMAAANSNTATRHLLQSSLYITLTMAECIAMRVSDVIEYSPTKESFIKTLGKFNVSTLEEMANLHLHDFGIFLELTPDEEEKAKLENNIQVALQSGQIYLEDAIEVREVRNIKLANQLLKIRRKKKQQLDQEQQQRNIQAQTQSNTQSAQAAAQADMQKQQALTESKAQLEQIKNQLEIAKMEREAAIKKELMEHEFNLNMQLQEMQLKQVNDKDKFKEDRKDERTKIQASQQSELIDQRKNNAPPKSFESAGMDNLGGFGLEQFEPR